MTDAQVTNFCDPVYGKKLCVQNPPLKVNERVIWLLDSGPEAGTVRWVGLLPDVGNDWTAGVELDNPVGNNDGAWGSLRLFTTKPRHGLIIPIAGLMKEDEFLGKPSNLQFPSPEKRFFQQSSPNIPNGPLQYVHKNGLIKNESLVVGERIVWISKRCKPEHGLIRWLGFLDNDPKFIAGVEFDNPVGNGVGCYKDVRYFNARCNHASFIPLVQLVRETDYMLSLSVNHNHMNSIEMEQNQKRYFEGTYDNFHWNSISYDINATRCITKELPNAEDKSKKVNSENKPTALALQLATDIASGNISNTLLCKENSYEHSTDTADLDKWYDAIDFSTNLRNGSLRTSCSLDSVNTGDNSSILSLDSTSSDKNTKEGSGLFSFFRWFRFKKTKKKQKIKMTKIDPEHLKASSIPSVTSISDSFHYVPVTFGPMQKINRLFKNSSSEINKIEDNKSSKSLETAKVISSSDVGLGLPKEKRDLESIKPRSMSSSYTETIAVCDPEIEKPAEREKFWKSSTGTLTTKIRRRKKRRAPSPPLNKFKTNPSLKQPNLRMNATMPAKNKDQHPEILAPGHKKNSHIKGKRKAPSPPLKRTGISVEEVASSGYVPRNSPCISSDNKKFGTYNKNKDEKAGCAISAETPVMGRPHSTPILVNKIMESSAKNTFSLSSSCEKPSAEATDMKNLFVYKESKCDTSSSGDDTEVIPLPVDGKENQSSRKLLDDINEGIHNGVYGLEKDKRISTNLLVTNEWKNRNQSTQKLIEMFNALSILSNTNDTITNEMSTGSAACHLLRNGDINKELVCANELKVNGTSSNNIISEKSINMQKPKSFVVYMNSNCSETLKLEIVENENFRLISDKFVPVDSAANNFSQETHHPVCSESSEVPQTDEKSLALPKIIDVRSATSNHIYENINELRLKLANERKDSETSKPQNDPHVESSFNWYKKFPYRQSDLKMESNELNGIQEKEVKDVDCSHVAKLGKNDNEENVKNVLVNSKETEEKKCLGFYYPKKSRSNSRHEIEKINSSTSCEDNSTSSSESRKSGVSSKIELSKNLKDFIQNNRVSIKFPSSSAKDTIDNTDDSILQQPLSVSAVKENKNGNSVLREDISISHSKSADKPNFKDNFTFEGKSIKRETDFKISQVLKRTEAHPYFKKYYSNPSSQDLSNNKNTSVIENTSASCNISKMSSASRSFRGVTNSTSDNLNAFNNHSMSTQEGDAIECKAETGKRLEDENVRIRGFRNYNVIPKRITHSSQFNHNSQNVLKGNDFSPTSLNGNMFFSQNNESVPASNRGYQADRLFANPGKKISLASSVTLKSNEAPLGHANDIHPSHFSVSGLRNKRENVIVNPEIVRTDSTFLSNATFKPRAGEETPKFDKALIIKPNATSCSLNDDKSTLKINNLAFSLEKSTSSTSVIGDMSQLTVPSSEPRIFKNLDNSLVGSMCNEGMESLLVREDLFSKLWPPFYEIIAPELVQLKAKFGHSAEIHKVNLLESLSDVEVSKILRQLELAISRGHTEVASRLARKLAMHKISCSIIRKKPRLKPSSDEEFYVNIFVEDRSSHIGPFILYIKPYMSVGELKRLVEKEFDFPAVIQRWILGKKLATDDNATLLSYGIDSNGCPVYLYLMTTDVDKITVYRKRLSNYLDALERLEEEAEEEEDDDDDDDANEFVECNNSVDINGIVKGEEVSNASNVSQENKTCKTIEKNQQPEIEGWSCPVCTLVNAPTRPGCSACTTSRPEDYVIPSNYRASEEEELRLLREREAEEIAKKAREEERLRNYQKLIDLEDSDVICNTEPFECPICFVEIQEREGIILRDCVHMFCRECLSQTIAHSETAEVKCPFMDEEYSCQAILQEREIKVLVTPEVYERHLQRSMAIAESQAENSFHCKTKDCHSWCFYEDDINEFRCPVCRHLNCLTCRAIHEGLNCHQYQEKLELECSQNEESQKTKAYFDEMLLKGQAMRCPQCQIILMKKWGCDWLQCTMCRTEICWVTKGRRWGPNGHGDISGGCRCGVNGKRCHALCNYCH